VETDKHTVVELLKEENFTSKIEFKAYLHENT
jgi:hypothetical protein